MKQNEKKGGNYGNKSNNMKAEDRLKSLMTHDKETIANWYLDLLQQCQKRDELIKVQDELIDKFYHFDSLTLDEEELFKKIEQFKSEIDKQ